MAFLLEIGQIFLTAFIYSFLMPIFWVVLFLVYLQYRRQAEREEKLYGRVINPIKGQMLGSLVFGAAGGLGASAVLVFLGLSLDQIGLYFIWPLALLLLLIHPRYLCFAYGGGIIALTVLFTRHVVLPFYPVIEETAFFAALLDIHIPSLLVLIALLHLVESLLIFGSGHRGKSPIYLKQEDGLVVGAFMLQRFWPLPLVALLVTIVPEAEIVGVNMPDWWPILQSLRQPEAGQILQYLIIPVAAGLGYADIAMASSPLEKSRHSAGGLAVYSVTLLLFALAAEYWSFLVIPAVLLAPFGHEALILFGNKAERELKPLFVKSGSPVPLMMVLPDSAAEKAGLQNGDFILKVNGKTIDSSAGLLEEINQSYFMVLLDGKRKGEPFSVILNKRLVEKKLERDRSGSAGSGNPLGYKGGNILHCCAAIGFIPVPPPDSPIYVEMKQSGFGVRWAALKNRFKRIFLRSRKE